MSEIRSLRREEIPQIAALYRFVDRSDWRIPPAELPAWFERTLFGHPWVDPEIPTLVYADDSGEILGFIASHVRRLRFDGRTIRMGAAGPLIAHPKVRSRGVGAQLWRRYLAGPQELTVTDGASDEMREIFELIGGQMLHPSCIAWARVYRPFGFLGDRALHARPWPREHLKAPARRVWSPLDSVAAHAVRYFAAPSSPKTISEPLTPALLIEHLPTVTRSLRLFPDYDEAFVEWLFAEQHYNRTWGTPVRRLVRTLDGRVLGWYIYFLLRAGSCHVLQVAAQRRHVGAVLDDLFADAIGGGGTAIQGRVEPLLLAPLAHRGALFRYSPRSLVYSPHDDLLGVVTSDRTMLTRLEGEWWMAT
jgi:GNAT superfamily N-acetyltransferase